MFSNFLFLSVLCLLQHDHRALAVRDVESEWFAPDESKASNSPKFPDSNSVPVSTNKNLTKSIASMLTSFFEAKSGVESVLRSQRMVEDISTVLRFEFFTIATGDHFVFTKSNDNKSEETRHKKAAAVSAMWSDLFLMDDVDDIMKNASSEVAKKLAQSTGESNDWQNALTLLFDNVQQSIEQEDFLQIMYLSEQLRFINRIRTMDPLKRKTYIGVSPESNAVREETIVEWLTQPAIRKFLVNKLFLQHRVKPNKDVEDEQNERYLSTRAILKIAHDRCCMEQTQKIYNEAVAETAESFILADYPKNTIQQLYTELAKKLENDSKLQAEFEKARKKLVGKAKPKEPASKKKYIPK